MATAKRSFFIKYLAVAAAVLIPIGIGVTLWWSFKKSEVEKALVDLNSHFHQQRPLESRISTLTYSPFSSAQTSISDDKHRGELHGIALRLVADLRKKPTAAAHQALGTVYLAEKKFDDGIKEFEAALKTDPRNPNILSDLGAAYLEIGKSKLSASDSRLGFEELARGADNFKHALDLSPNLLDSIFNQALCKEWLKLNQQAEDEWRLYLQRDSTSLWAGEARLRIRNLETRQQQSSQNNELINNFLKAYDTGNDNDAWAAISRSRTRSGNSIVAALIDDYLNLSKEGKTTEAAVKLRILAYEAEIEDKVVGDKLTADVVHFYSSGTDVRQQQAMQARGLMKSAYQRYDKAEYQQAIELYEQARQLFSQAQDQAESLFAESWIGYCYLRIPDAEKSLKIFQRLTTTFAVRNYRSLYAQALIASADAFTSRNEYSKALQSANHSLAVAEQIHDSATAVRCLQAETSMQLMFGDYQASLAAAFRALDLAEKLPSDPRLIWPFYHEASLDFYFLGSPASALDFENEALRLATNSGLSLHASRSYDRLGLLNGRLHNYEIAIRNTEQARAVGDAVADELPRTNIQAHSALNLGKLYRESGDLRRAVGFYDQAIALYKKLNLEIYEYESHKGKLLALIELHDAAAASELQTVLYWFEQNRLKIAEESYRNKFFDTDQNTYDVAIDFEYSTRKDAMKAFDYAESSRARSLLELMSKHGKLADHEEVPEITLTADTKALSLPQIQRLLPEQVQLLEYAVLKDKITIWVVTRHAWQAVDTRISREELDKKIFKFLNLLSGGDAGDGKVAASIARDLYAALIAPVEHLLDHRLQLCIVPDKNLNFVPFGALLSPAAGKYLVENFALEIAPSATVFVASSEHARAKEGNKTERLLVVGDPHFDRQRFRDLPYLPETKREAEDVAAMYGAAPLIGEAAVSWRVNQLMRGADVIHFATHAIADERSPLLSKLLLSTSDAEADQNRHHSGFLQASEIYQMTLSRTRLVVLSACRTGIERAYRGEGAIGLSRPFIAAGVPIVVASLWPVETEATAKLLISFHKHRTRDQVSTVEALRRAQLDFIRNQQQDSPPNYGWAAFVAIGGHTNF